jgi:hypothetical protein
VNWFYLAEDTVHWRASLNTVMNHQVLLETRTLLRKKLTISLGRRIVLEGDILITNLFSDALSAVYVFKKFVVGWPTITFRLDIL